MNKKKGTSPTICSYVKRPDLRPEEIPSFEVCSDQDAESWIWHIEGNDLFNELGCDHGEIFSVDLPIYPDIHGIPDPIKIAAFFCACHEWRVYPPAWIMDDLYRRFSEYLEENGAGNPKRLGEFFGEPATGTRRPKFKELVFGPMMETACGDVDRLEHWVGVSTKDALDIVAFRLEIAQEKVPSGWQGERTKGRAALVKAHQAWRRKGTTDHFREIWDKNGLPTDDNLLHLLERHEDCLLGPKYSRLRKRLKELRDLKRLRETETKF